MSTTNIFTVAKQLEDKFKGKFGVTSIEALDNKGIIRVLYKRENLIGIRQSELSNLIQKSAEPFGVVIIPIN